MSHEHAWEDTDEIRSTRFRTTKKCACGAFASLYTDGQIRELSPGTIRSWMRLKKPRHCLDLCRVDGCVECATRLARLSAPDRSIRVTRVDSLPRQVARPFVESPRIDCASFIKARAR